MVNLSKTDEGIDWIKQFRIDDQSCASQLLDAIKLVNHDEFVNSLRQNILEKTKNVNGVVALFSEREIRKSKNGVLHKLFRQPYRKKNRRATGHGPQPVKPNRNSDLRIGSEGIVSWLVSEICTENPKKFLCHPSPDQIRKKKVRKFLLVTDIIGSGNRVRDYLESAWSVASVKSWCSFGYLSFGVVAYTGTRSGVESVKRHRTKPTISLVKPCPTISTEFDEAMSKRIKLLCVNYDPVDKHLIDSLGYCGSSALIVFSHGCPNNVPRMLHSCRNKSWSPIFPKRRTAATRHIFGEKNYESELIRKLEGLHEARMARGYWLSNVGKEGRKIVLVLAALRRGPRFNEALARKTSLSIPEIEIIIEKCIHWNWLSEKRHLTDTGKGQLAHARKSTKSKVEINKEKINNYYPKSLRAPTNASS